MTVKTSSAYTGVGSRNILPQETNIIIQTAGLLAKKYKLRSGKADGSDLTFMEGAIQHGGEYINYTPWKNFQGGVGDHDFWVNCCDQNIRREAETIARIIHPNWAACNGAVRRMHMRNVLQVLGHELNEPSKLLLACSSEDMNGDVLGGTRTAWMLAKLRCIPVLNIRDKTLEQVLEWVGQYS